MNFGQLLEQWYILKLKKQLNDSDPNATFMYNVDLRRKIFQFIDFI